VTAVDSGPSLSAPLRPRLRLTTPPTARHRPHRPGHRTARRLLLRHGVQPLLFAVDGLAWTLSAWLTPAPLAHDVAFLVVAVALYAHAGLYRSRLSLSVLDDAPALAGRVLAAAAITTALVLAVTGIVADDGVLLAALVLSLAVVVLRAAAYDLVRRCRRRGWVDHPVLVLGAGHVGGQIASLLLEHREHGLRPVGFLDGDPLLAPDQRPVPVLGAPDELAHVIAEFGIQDVVVAFGSVPEPEMVDVLRTCDRLDVEIFFVPRLFELHNEGRDVDQVWGLPLVRLRRAALRSPSWRLKRVLDVVAASLALVLLAPVLVLVALAVRIAGGPGVLFRQERIGADGRPFTLLKFRSLKPADDSEASTTWNIGNDARLGPVGRFLRSTSLDELPQLVNIVRGEMSLVGPRPERPHFVAQFSRSAPRYPARHRVPAGLTGWAQVHGLRGDTSIEERARFDNYYIENWSLWLDVKVLLRTVTAVLARSGS
jgi:exopolysaccharide biosynthesis polyprenyl glycosylphosphotransferase